MSDTHSLAQSKMAPSQWAGVMALKDEISRLTAALAAKDAEVAATRREGAEMGIRWMWVRQ